MSRPTKQGIDYFPVDANFDEKIELFVAETGAEGLGVLMTVWQLIYSLEGYYIDYSDDLFLLIKRRVMIDTKTIKSLIEKMITRKIFDNELYKTFKILTSKAIQKRYFEASKRKRMVCVNKNYLCMGINVSNNATNIETSGINVSNNATKEEVKEEVKEKEKENIIEFSPTSEKLARKLFSLIQQNDSKVKKPNFSSWAGTIDKLMRIDGRSEQEIGEVMEWCQNDDFWKSNILSPDKLKKQFTKLVIKMNQTNERENDMFKGLR